MDFDLDDPLGDLLSDGSNDSFFGTSKKKTETLKPATQAANDTKVKSSRVADLFGIGTNNGKQLIEATPKPSSNSNIISSSEKNPSKEESAISSQKNLRQSIKRSPAESNLQQVSIKATEPRNRNTNTQKQSMKKDTQFDDDSDDFLNELGFDPKYPKGNLVGGKKTNILDDILNFSKPETVTKSIPLTPAPKPNGTDPDKSSLKTIDSQQTTNRYSPSSRRVRNLPRSVSGGSDTDPLGLFASPSEQKSQEIRKNESVETTMRQKNTKKVPVDWLGLDNESEVKIKTPVTPPTSVQAKAQTAQTPDYAAIPNATVPIEVNSGVGNDSTLTNNIQNMTSTPANNISANLSGMNMASMEQSLKQQEMHLRIAAQMKQQETILNDMHVKQKNLIKQQENQFNDLLRRQIYRQNQLETQIQRQQDQINEYINVLMTQPNFGDQFELTESQKIEKDTSRQHFIELEADVKRLEVEKTRLEDVLQSVQSAHEQELELLHISHKKQISLLEESLDSLEKRLREEIKSTEAYHLSKNTVLQTDIESQQQKYEEYIKKLIDDYERKIEKLRFNFENDLDALKNDQRSTIENIRQAKFYEFSALQESGSYLNTLKTASDHLENASGNLESMRVNIKSTIERIHDERETQLNVKEQSLNDKQKFIDKSIEKTEEERTRLIELIRSLEIKLSSVEQSSNEEQWNLRQKSASLEAERVSFEREKKFMREKLSVEEKRIQELKEKQFDEHKHMMNLLDAEREQILIEKAKLETMEHLKTSSSSPTTKRQSELDAAIKIAQDAASSADIEHKKIIEQQRKLKLKERELMDKENHLQAQQSELELRMSEANDQRLIAEHTTKTCKSLEQKLLVKLQSLQENYIELTGREANLSQAKIDLGKERMELQHLRQQLRQSKCSLCRIGAKNTEISELDPLNDIAIHEKPSMKFDTILSKSFDGLQQQLSNVEAMIDDAIINVPQSPNSRHVYRLSSDGHLPNTNSFIKSIIDPF